MSDLANHTLGKYDVIREVGRGSMGVVYLAHDQFADREVALKVALPEALHDPMGGARYRKMFFNEAKVAGKLRHPNIISVYDAGVEDEHCYIVMEYVPGGQTLYGHCRKEGLLPIEDVVRVAFKCVRALDYAHRQGVIHRDIKPRNIMLTEQREVKLGDFSIALLNQAELSDTQVHGYVGSPLYMSPEQIMESPVTGQTDIFSIGVVMYEMLTGKHPFTADSLTTIISRITKEPPTPLLELRPEVPPILAHIVDRALKKTSGERYKTGLDVAADLSLVFDHLELFKVGLSDHEKLELVKELTFFTDFSEAEVEEVIKASQWLEFDPGTTIIVEGAVDNSFYIMVSGEVAVHKAGTDLGILGPGDCFGEMALAGNRSRSATIQARSAVTAMKVRASLIEQASVHCQLRFYKVFLRTLIERLSSATARVSGQSLPT